MYKIFISGPYTKGDVALNVKKAMDVSNILMERDYAPYCPHLTHFLHMNNQQPYEKWLELDCQFLVLCDAIYRLDGESNGADKEVKLAKERCIPVFYSLEDLYNHFEKTKGA
ncbi:DUF7768 domain-containing protein [Labilibaculum euxinus]|uniref:DUF4406 domain-containing protein n=1 Tax=Labilibaculum euxinus TaxID=2686357 RepID=A0A7M4D2D1_9BACT|nr:DUF4406 domain-containing protein [Labilibaculum euxinus]MUP36810.1 DUF4406 domain-containing protein [Labilibaculum euxinus]MVB06015.1 DUF4406 domain-containing protein [Labilibaculum euxinus]